MAGSFWKFLAVSAAAAAAAAAAAVWRLPVAPGGGCCGIYLHTLFHIYIYIIIYNIVVTVVNRYQLTLWMLRKYPLVACKLLYFRDSFC